MHREKTILIEIRLADSIFMKRRNNITASSVVKLVRVNL